MKKLLLGSTMLLAMVAGAAAADLPIYTKAPPPIWSWTGFYIGANGGGAWGQSCWTFEGFVPPAGPVQDDGCHNVSGGLFGGQAGLNWQTGAFVLGVEAQGDWANLTGSNRPALGNISQFNVDSTNVRSIVTVTGRIGYAWDRVLLYAKGGAAWTRDNYEVDTTATLAGGAITATTGLSDTRSGWVVGAGLEYGLARNWSVAAEYNYMNFGTKTETIPTSISPPGLFAPFTENISQTIQTATVRLNYRFGGFGGY
jgi:outer membrane immunogenic protein